MKKHLLLAIAAVLAASGLQTAVAQQETPDPAKWYRLIGDTGPAPRTGYCIEVANASTAGPNSSQPGASNYGKLWCGNPVSSHAANFDSQLWRFEEDPNNPGKYAMISKADESKSVGTPSGSALTDRWTLADGKNYHIILASTHSGSSTYKTLADGTFGYAITSTSLTENYMNLSAAGQNFAINVYSNPLDGDDGIFYFHEVDLTEHPDVIELTSADGAVSSSSNLLWTSTTTPKTTITLNGGNFLTESAYNGNIAINTAGTTRTVTIAPAYDWCYVAGYSMTVTGYSGDGVIINAGDQTLTTDDTEKTVTVSGLTSDTPASFTIAPTINEHAKKLLIKNVTITYALKNTDAMLEAANQEIQATSNERINNIYFGYKGLFSAAEQAEISSDFTVTELTGIADVQNAVQAIDVIANSTIPERLNGRVIYVLNKRRQQTSPSFSPAYLTITDGGINTISYPSELGKWLLVRDGQTANFSLYSLERNSYLAMGSENATLTSDASASQKFYFDANPYLNGFGAAIHFVNSGNGFNLDTNNSALTKWGYADPGSSWVFELAGSTAENLVDGKYYRIRSNRAMYDASGNLKTSGSLLGINTVIEDGATENEGQQVISKHDGFGTVWQLKAVEGGKYQLLNAAADFIGNEQLFAIGKQSDESRNAYAASTNAANFVIFNATDRNYGSYAGHIPYTIALATPDITGGNGSCMDYNGSAYVLSEWNPGNDEYNNGSTYYFEPLADAEFTAMQNAYVNATNGTVNFDAAKYTGYEVLFGGIDSAKYTDYCATIDSYKNEYDQAFITGVVDVKTANSAATNVALITNYTALVHDAASNAIGSTYVQFSNATRGDTDRYISVGDRINSTTANPTVVRTSTDANNLSTVWNLELTEGLNFKLHNYGTNYYAGHTNDLETELPIAETADAAHVYNLTRLDDGQFTLSAREGNYPLLHIAGGNFRIVKWVTSDASNWSASAVDTEEMYPANDPESKIDFIGEVNENTINSLIFSIKSGSLALSQGLGSHLVLTVERFDPADFAGQSSVALMAEENGSEPQPTATYQFTGADVQDIGTGLKFTHADEAIEAGVLRITAPMGFFTVNGKLSAPFTVHYTLAENGTTTGVNEVNVADEEAEVMWYTVQGVRVAQPASTGVYIRVAAGKASKVFVTK